LLHQYQRTTQSFNGITHIIADLADYEIAVELSRAVLGRVLAGITPSCEQIVSVVSNQFQGEFTRSEVSAAMDWSRATTDKYLREAVSVGCLEISEGSRGKLYKYRFVKLAKQIEVNLPSKDEIAALMQQEGDARPA
jgi:response regulator of citrate/malate metabolism